MRRLHTTSWRLRLATLCACTGIVMLGTSPAQSAEPLRPQKAYPYHVQVEAQQLLVSFDIVNGYYLYRDRFAFKSRTPGISLGQPQLPPGQIHEDEFFGKQQIYRGHVEIVIPYRRTSDAGNELTLETHLQGCADLGICYPPQTWIRQVDLSGVPPGGTSNGTPGTSAAFDASASSGVAPPSATGSTVTRGAAGAVTAVSEQGRFAAVALGGSWWVLLGIFYAAGLALAFTPCVLPLVPIISGIIAGQQSPSNRRAFALSASYVLGMALTYTVAGAIAALVGQQLQAVFQKPWIISAFAALFVLLALSMFGAYNLQMPPAIQARITAVANRQRTGSYIGTLIMGALSALIVTTCVAPALVGALAVIGQQGNVVRGAAALFALSIGMGTPLLLIGTSAGILLPQAGRWMNAVKAGCGVLMLGVAIWMLERILPSALTLALWAMLVFFTGVFLGAFESLPSQPGAARRLAKGAGVLACLYGALMLIGSTLGGSDPLQPIPHSILATATGNTVPRSLAANRSAGALEFRPIESVAALRSALASARAAEQPVLVDFTADWCVDCKRMQKYTFSDPAVESALEPFALLRIDVTANTAEDQALLAYFNSYGPPTMAFYDEQGQRRKAFQLVGFVPAEQFIDHVARLESL